MRNLAAASLDWMLDNPVINKELRGRMRGPRAYWMMLGYLVILSIAMLITYYAWRQQQGYGAASFTVGRTFFRIIFYVQATLVSLITPALTSGSISVEREQRTYDMMRCTNLRPSSIVGGKLFSAISFVALLLVCSIPLISVCFLVGGVSPDEVLATYAMLIVDGVLFGAIGIAWSTCAANTAGATALSYLSVFVYFLLTVVPATSAQVQSGVTTPLTALNPVGAATAAVTMEHYYGFVIPAWVTGVVLNGLFAVLLCAIAVNRMDDYPWKRAAGVRAAAFARAAAVLFFLDGAWVSHAFPAYTASTEAFGIIFTGMLVLMCVLPSLVTGDPSSELEHGLPISPPIVGPVRAFREATSRSSLMICALFTAFVTAITLVSINMGAAGMAMAGGGSSMDIGACRTATVGLYAGLTAAMFGVGWLLSSLMRSRWGAMILVFVIVALASIVPMVTFSGVTAGIQRNWLYMSMPWSIATLDPTDNSYTQAGLLLYGTVPSWLVTSTVYALIGCLCFAIASTARRKLARNYQ